MNIYINMNYAAKILQDYIDISNGLELSFIPKNPDKTVRVGILANGSFDSSDTTYNHVYGTDYVITNNILIGGDTGIYYAYPNFLNFILFLVKETSFFTFFLFIISWFLLWTGSSWCSLYFLFRTK